MIDKNKVSWMNKDMFKRDLNWIFKSRMRMPRMVFIPEKTELFEIIHSSTPESYAIIKLSHSKGHEEYIDIYEFDRDNGCEIWVETLKGYVPESGELSELRQWLERTDLSNTFLVLENFGWFPKEHQRLLYNIMDPDPSRIFPISTKCIFMGTYSVNGDKILVERGFAHRKVMSYCYYDEHYQYPID
jgi:hypothetical protein